MCKRPKIGYELGVGEFKINTGDIFRDDLFESRMQSILTRETLYNFTITQTSQLRSCIAEPLCPTREITLGNSYTRVHCFSSARCP